MNLEICLPTGRQEVWIYIDRPPPITRENLQIQHILISLLFRLMGRFLELFFSGIMLSVFFIRCLPYYYNSYQHSRV